MNLLTTPRVDMSFCPGCSHGLVLEHLAAAFERLNLKPEDICLVSDIGCVGIADRYFACHTFHGLHGRSITYAEGIKRARPDLHVVVLIGDGGCGIGTAHLVHAARRGVDIKVVVCNNFNFGMTGGQHSPTTPPCAVTTTTPSGAEGHPFDICGTVQVNGASYVARRSAFDPVCVTDVEIALREPGFALLDFWELCVAYYVAENKLTRPGLEEMSRQLKLPFGVWRREGESARVSSPAVAASSRSLPQRTTADPTVRWAWPSRRELTVAGAAGQRIRSAAGVIGELAVSAGLFAAQQDDFPITVRKGHSVSNLVLAAGPIHYTGVDHPDLLVLLSDEGTSRVGPPANWTSDLLAVVDREVLLPPTSARVKRVDGRRLEKAAGKASAALAALCAGIIDAGWLTGESLISAAEAYLRGQYREENLRAVRAGVEAALESTMV